MRNRFLIATLPALLLGSFVGCDPIPPSIVERAALKGHSREVVSIAFAPDGKILASRGADAIKLWDVFQGVESSAFPSDGSDFGSVVFAPDGKTLASERIGIGAVAWDLTGRERSSYAFPPVKSATPTGSTTKGWGLAYSPDGRTLVGGGSRGTEDGFLTLWETSMGEGSELAPLRRPITTVAYSPDGKTIASGSMDGKLVLWDVATRRERLPIASKRSYLAPVVFSPDGRVVASTNEARWVMLWDVATGRDVGTMKGHLKAVLSLAFHPDGKTLVSGDSGGTLFVWDLPSLKMATRLESSDRGKVWGLAFSPDGKTLACSGEDRLIHLFDVSWPARAGEGR
jgi:WD40 repeat protein